MAYYSVDWIHGGTRIQLETVHWMQGVIGIQVGYCMHGITTAYYSVFQIHGVIVAY